MTGYIYVLQGLESGHLKVGISMDPFRRLKQIAGGGHEELELLAFFPGDLWTEKAIHRSLSEHRVRGEWYRDCAVVRQLLVPSALSESARRSDLTLADHAQLLHDDLARFAERFELWALEKRLAKAAA